ncbi:flagellar protein FlaG [Hankyongella ginsenosidimutans]|uniref:Flagellar protein FlaG n=1 Tax=Hankyongella ginsenosidimutans TaxID=1763828 RepID=A0A4D7CCA9_9SPHN|nr:flagellar protein FlaG [Hankyongella ginsenosidimutans]QCI80192.1 flagellar protein FlaG [Hankyongella ginsenosidimutans]
MHRASCRSSLSRRPIWLSSTSRRRRGRIGRCDHKSERRPFRRCRASAISGRRKRRGTAKGTPARLARRTGGFLPQNAKLSIRLDKDANRFVYEFLDPKTGEVTAQFPTEEVLKLLKANNQPVSGAALDRTA